MRGLIVILIVFLASGCSGGITHKPPGEYKVGSSYSITTSTPWSHIAGNPQQWTIDGPSLGLLQTWAGLKSGDALVRRQGRKTPVFRSTFGALEVAEMVSDTIEALVPGADVETTDFRPIAFGSQDGFRFQVRYVRKGLPMRGVAAGAVRNGMLDLLLFTAPAEHYFDMYAAEIDHIIGSVKSPV